MRPFFFYSSLKKKTDEEHLKRMSEGLRNIFFLWFLNLGIKQNLYLNLSKRLIKVMHIYGTLKKFGDKKT